MTEEEMLEAMLADSKKVNKRYRDKWGGKIDKKFLEPTRQPEPEPEPETTAAPPKSSGWRKISQDQIEDILYFQSKGWCVTSTAIFLGLSKSTVQKYRERQD
jgi:hypothetical protein